VTAADAVVSGYGGTEAVTVDRTTAAVSAERQSTADRASSTTSLPRQLRRVQSHPAASS